MLCEKCFSLESNVSNWCVWGVGVEGHSSEEPITLSAPEEGTTQNKTSEEFSFLHRALSVSDRVLSLARRRGKAGWAEGWGDSADPAEETTLPCHDPPPPEAT